MMKKFFFLNLVLLSFAHASSFHWFCGVGAGSKYFWESGTTAGSKYYWEKGEGPGSLYYWNNGLGPGSKYFWINGTEAGSQYYFQRGDGPDSLYFWNRGTGEGSRHSWMTSMSKSTKDIFVPLCLANLMVSPVCDALYETSRSNSIPYDCNIRLGERVQHMLRSVTQPPGLDCVESTEISEQ